MLKEHGSKGSKNLSKAKFKKTHPQESRKRLEGEENLSLILTTQKCKKNIKKVGFILSLLFTLSILTISCQKDSLEEFRLDTEEMSKEGMLQLGTKIPNAYTIENMTQAFINLKESSKKSIIDLDLPLSPTHYYVRFLPRSFQELAILHKDTLLILFDFPLDFEILGDGTYYHDPSLPKDAITWQYCTVEFDYEFPNLDYEILEELFLPDSKIGNVSLKSSPDLSFWYDLEDEARRIVGIEDSSDLKSVKGSRVYPAGRIRIDDNCGLGTIGLEGVQVIATRGFTSKKGYTNSSGYFNINHGFRGSVTYKIKWERDDFDIRTGTYGQAYYNGPKQDTDWNLTLNAGSISWCYGHIHRGAYLYYYKNNIYGIQAPPRQGGILNQRLHIGAMNKSGRSHYYDFNSFAFAAQLKVYCKYTSGGYKTSGHLFAISIHELAHASHWDLGYSTAQYLIDFIFNDALLPESWASCVEHVITSDVYSATTSSTYNNWGHRQSMTISSFDSTGYTPLFIDLIDDFNQREMNSGNTDFPIDDVCSYTLSELEYILDKTYIDLSSYGASVLEPIWETFALTIYENKIRNEYSNDSEDYLDELFDCYK